MTELVLAKTPGGALVPADPVSTEFIRTLKIGAGLRGEFKRQRNPLFHRKMFALFGFAFDLWDAPELEYRGQQVAKSFDRFRKDLTILAGYYEAVTNLRGEVRLEAKSLAFANMDEAEFEQVFKAVLDVTWTHILKAKGYETPERIENIVNGLLRFE